MSKQTKMSDSKQADGIPGQKSRFLYFKEINLGFGNNPKNYNKYP